MLMVQLALLVKSPLLMRATSHSNILEYKSFAIVLRQVST
jgi:hypothetical protein